MAKIVSVEVLHGSTSSPQGEAGRRRAELRTRRRRRWCASPMPTASPAPATATRSAPAAPSVMRADRRRTLAARPDRPRGRGDRGALARAAVLPTSTPPRYRRPHLDRARGDRHGAVGPASARKARAAAASSSPAGRRNGIRRSTTTEGGWLHHGRGRARSRTRVRAKERRVRGHQGEGRPAACRTRT
jgi:hypothetical protein